MPLIKSKFELAEPGVDPIANPLPRDNKPTIPWFLVISGTLLAMVLLLKFCTPKTTAEAFKPTIDATRLQQVVEQTLTAAPSWTPTITATYTSTATLRPDQPTQPPMFITASSGSGSPTPPTPITSVREVTRVVYINSNTYLEVTRLVPVQQTRIVLVMITNTPGPTHTPWIITVVVAPTETYTPTPSLTPTVEELIPTDTETPTETPTETATETATETPEN